MRALYGRSPWLDRFPKTRVPSYSKYRGDLDVDVAVIGGGLTGCATAYTFAAAGIKVALFEADRIGRGATAASVGWITEDPSPSFLQVERALGRRETKHAWHAWRRAALDFTALIRRLDLQVHLAARPALTVARSGDEQLLLSREQHARKEAGVGAVLLNGRAANAIAGFPLAGALKTRDNAMLDPYRAALGLAAAAAERGARIFEGSPVVKTAFTRRSAAVVLATGTVRVGRIVVATGGPTPLFKPLVRHFGMRSTFNVLTEPIAPRLRQTLGSRDHLIRDSSQPPHWIASVDDSRLLVSGADSNTTPAKSKDKVLVQRTGQLMYELSTLYPDISGLLPAYGWDTPYAQTSHGLPIVGPHRNYPFHLFALGAGGHSLTGSFLASRILLRHYADDVQASDLVFGFAL